MDGEGANLRFTGQTEITDEIIGAVDNVNTLYDHGTQGQEY